MKRPVASLSLDLDNQWSYMKTHGDPGWESFPTYLDVVVPRVLDLLAEDQLLITWFIVGQDAALQKNSEALGAISEAGHEIGNHSFHHEPWLHLYTDQEVEDEIRRAEECIESVTGRRTLGFRGPGFSVSQTVVNVLKRRGYVYDASTFPTFLGPLARAYYFMTANLDDEEMKQRDKLFGGFNEGFRPLRPYRLYEVDENEDGLIEIPVTTMPVFKTPIHLSYIMYLAQFSRLLARTYFQMSMRLCQLTGIAPSFLLHPLDFMGKDDKTGLDFFPAMGMESAAKLDIAREVFAGLDKYFELCPMKEHAEHIRSAKKAPAALPAATLTPAALTNK